MRWWRWWRLKLRLWRCGYRLLRLGLRRKIVCGEFGEVLLSVDGIVMSGPEAN